MIDRLLEERIRAYAPQSAVEQEAVLAEILQHYVLVGLARAGFFAAAGFHGGTFLRIVHGLDRFSEDLDFVLKAPDQTFTWDSYLRPLAKYLAAEGISVEAEKRADSNHQAVRKTVLKTEAFGEAIAVRLPHARHRHRKIRVMLEVDANPPAGSRFETSYVSFPVLTPITTQTLSSAFGSKSHALLCRPYAKGRDWYDFLWYVAHAVHPDLSLLQNAVEQCGPWAGQGLTVTPAWYAQRLRQVIAAMDWRKAAADVARFLHARSRFPTAQWNRELFWFHVEKLERSLSAVEPEAEEETP